MEFSVIIATCGRPAQLGVVLDCLLQGKLQHGHPVEVIVVDNHPDGTSATVVAKWGDSPLHVRYIRSRPYDKAAALNVGIRAAGTEWLAFTDDDTLPRGDWLKRGACYAGDSGLRVFGGQIKAGILDEGRMPIWMRKAKSGRMPLTGVIVQYAPKGMSGELTAGMTAPFGANLFVRKDVFAEYGFYDEKLWALCVKFGKWPVGVEDSEIGYRLLRRREPLGYCHEAVVEHPINYDRCLLRLSIWQAFCDGWRQPLIFMCDYQRPFEWFRVRILFGHLLRGVGACVQANWSASAYHIIEGARCGGSILGRLSRAFTERRLQEVG